MTNNFTINATKVIFIQNQTQSHVDSDDELIAQFVNSDRPRAAPHSVQPATPTHSSNPNSDEGIPELIIPQPQPSRMSESEKQALMNQRDLKDEQDKAYKKSIERDTARAEENLRQLKEAEEDLLKKEYF